jgi:predicted GH43/DUF377 family glycosyl hydrolase
MSVLASVFQKLARFLRADDRSPSRKPVGVTTFDSTVALFSQLQSSTEIQLAASSDPYSFTVQRKTWKLPPSLANQSLSHVQSIRLHNHEYVFFQTSVDPQSSGRRSYLSRVTGDQLDQLYELLNIQEPAVLLPQAGPQDQLLFFVGTRAIQLATLTNPAHLTQAQLNPEPILTEAMPTQAGGAAITDHGLLLLYYKKQLRHDQTYYSAHLALFDAHQPHRLLWNLNEPIWEQSKEWPDKVIEPVGAVFIDNHFVSYWWVDKKLTLAIKHTGFKLETKKIVIHKKIALEKHAVNPLIQPDHSHDWEAFTTFNPSAIYLDNKVHILYRAQGHDYVSAIGYAMSQDGMTIDERLDQPIYAPTRDFETNSTESVNPSFVSGGGFGGCEDPRITMIDDTVYMMYVAFDGWSPPRLAMTSLSLANFLDRRWLWSKPVLLSPPGIVDKSGCLFPEKINGKYVILHRVFPNILIDYVDDLNFDGTSNWLTGQHQIKIRPQMWDSRKIGAGAPPLKTSEGWLLIYYGVDDKNAGEYHIGAMLLDLNEPAKVLYRSNRPILQPTESYEQTGFKPGVAYPCGAVIVNDKLLVYYGAADSVVCVASTDLATFLADLKSQTTIHWESFPVTAI